MPQQASNPYLAEVAQDAKAAGIDPVWAQSILLTESNGNQTAPSGGVLTSSQGAQGLMQVMPFNSQGSNLSDPDQNLQRGVAILADLYKKYNGNMTLATAAYHGGEDETQWGPKTHQYNATVNDNWNAIKAGKIVAPQTLTPNLDQFVSQSQAAPASPAPGAAPSATLTPNLDQFVSQSSAANPAPSDPFQIAPLSPAAAAQHPIANAAVNAANDIVDNPISQGIQRGAHVVLDAPAEALASGADKIGLTALLNKFGLSLPTGTQLAASDQAAQAAYKTQFAGDPIAQAANLGTQAAMVLPALESGAGAIRAGGNALLRGAGDFVTGNAGKNLLTRGASLAAGGALSGAGAAVDTAGGSDQSLGAQALEGAEGGAAAGPAMGAAGAIGNKLLGGVGIDPYIAQLAQRAVNLGIPLRAGQIAKNPLVRIADDTIAQIPGSGSGAQAEAIQTGMNRALANEMGASADRITPVVMGATKQRLGQIFDNVAANTSIKADPQIASDLAQTYTNAGQVLTEQELKPVANQIGNILDALGDDGVITGAQYQALTRSGAPLDRAMQSSDPNVRFYAGQVRDALDSALQRNAPPAMQQALSTARYQYKVMKTIEPLAEKSIDGNINPTLLMNEVRQRFGDIAYDGGGNMGDLARIGQMIKPPANSNTAARHMILNGLSSGAGVSAVGALLNPTDALLGLAGTAAVPIAARIVNTALNNKLTRNALLARALGKTTGPTVNALTAAAAQPAGAVIGAGTGGQ